MATKKPVAKTTSFPTDPNALYQAIVQAQNLQVDPKLSQQYTGAVENFNQGTQAQYLIPDQLKQYLGQISPQFTQNKEQVLAQFSDPNSPLYISNPFARLNAAQATGAAQKQTYSEILQGVQNLMGLGLEQKKQVVQGYQANVDAQQKAIEDRQKLLQQQFSNALSLQANARANANTTGDKAKYTIKQTQSGVDPITGLPNKDIQPGMQFQKDGIPVSPVEFSQATGTPLVRLLSSSPSPADQQLATQYQSLIDRANQGQNVTDDYRNLVQNNRHIFGLVTDKQVEDYLKQLGY